MDLSENVFRVLDKIDQKDTLTQRQLARESGISLGQVNYVLKSLLEKGLIKIRSFRKSTDKSVYSYLLTPKGIEIKSKAAVNFVVSKLEEYHQLQTKLSEKLAIIVESGHSRAIFVGPEIVYSFVDAIIKKNSLQLILIGSCLQWEELKKYKPESFDMILLFDANTQGIQTVTDNTGIPGEKFMYLW